MTNSIRTPRQGVTPRSRRIAEAVDDEKWQTFRLSLKGQSTETKLLRLHRYYDLNEHTHAEEEVNGHKLVSGRDDCDICIRVDNYLKALARGGQLTRGVNVVDAVILDWDLTILK